MNYKEKYILVKKIESLKEDSLQCIYDLVKSENADIRKTKNGILLNFNKLSEECLEKIKCYLESVNVSVQSKEEQNKVSEHDVIIFNFLCKYMKKNDGNKIKKKNVKTKVVKKEDDQCYIDPQMKSYFEEFYKNYRAVTFNRERKRTIDDLDDDENMIWMSSDSELTEETLSILSEFTESDLSLSDEDFY